MKRKRAFAGPRASSPRGARPRAESRTAATAGASARGSEELAQRLQKALAQLGLGSRREAEAWIRAGRLTVNGTIATLGTRVRPTDQVRLDGRLVRQRAPPPEQVFICHRSPGESLQRLTPAESSDAGEAPAREPLLARLPRTAGRRFVAVSPMPAVDGGLELVTSDGVLAAQLQRAVRLLTADFSVRVLGELTQAQLAGLREGVLDRGERLEILTCEPSGGEGANRWYTLTARGASGKDVRQLFERQGARVGRVLRTRLGPVTLDRTVARGQFRRLGAAQTQALLGASAERAPH
jgi:23S rRNA pseudouridine2605 synthase